VVVDALSRQEVVENNVIVTLIPESDLVGRIKQSW